ncbi:olfactory receptor 6N1-like [Engystomops pustulosus]|uniref:olfactory receptor 6N1-like n=1 Tax=Engystomops pustulosus TaxID=76066 RepID=UPI003AFAE0FB
MGNGNKTTVIEFVLLGFSSLDKLQIVVFCFVLLAYIICLLGNTIIFLLVRIDSSLHTPMYFFISTFTVLEIMYVSATAPELLAILIQTDNTISFYCCFSQSYAFNSLGQAECFLLCLMVFDRYLAINKPLHYSTIMNSRFCSKLAVLPWLLGFTIAMFPTVNTFRSDFCGSNEINHFFCDLEPLQDIACSDQFVNIMASIGVCFTSIILPFFAIVGFYIHIIYTVLKIKSKEGKMKAFSTCSSHLIVASLFYVSAIVVYVKPKGSHHDKFLALTYILVIPAVNPFIYTFRNREVKNALRKVVRQLIKQLQR